MLKMGGRCAHPNRTVLVEGIPPPAPAGSPANGADAYKTFLPVNTSIVATRNLRPPTMLSWLTRGVAGAPAVAASPEGWHSQFSSRRCFEHDVDFQMRRELAFGTQLDFRDAVGRGRDNHII